MGIWPLVIVALVAGFVGLLELDWAQLFSDPARELLMELWSRIEGSRDIAADLAIAGPGTGPVGIRLQALLHEGVVRLEFTAPPGLVGQIYTYRPTILVHYRPRGGGVRLVRTFPRGEAPELTLDPGKLRVSLEREVLGAGWDRFPRPALLLPGIAGSHSPQPGLAASPPPVIPLEGDWRLEIRGLPAPFSRAIVWIDPETGSIRRAAVALGKAWIAVTVERIELDVGLSLHDLLKVPPAGETIWYAGDHSM